MTFSKLGIDKETHQTVYLPKASRLQGLYIIGIQGTGKSGLIENLIMEDIHQQIGVCVLDPHGELIDHVIARLEPKHEQDVILLDIADEDHPFGLNLFTCTHPNSAKAVQEVVDQVRHIFEKLLGVSTDTPLILDYLYNCTSTLIVNPGYTMADIPLLLQDEQCRRKLVANVSDIDVLGFWRLHDQKRPSDQNNDIASTMRRVRQFLQPLSRLIVGQSTTTIDLQQIMSQGKILLVKLSAKVDSISSLIGSLMIALLLNAAYNRPPQRRQFHLYADEFQRFATEDFATLLEEARKFGIATTIAHQNRAQLESSDKQAEAKLKARTRSVANMVVFKINSEDADDLAGEFDTMPPPPKQEEATRRAIQTPVGHVIAHVLSRGGHTNPAVKRLIYSWQQTMQQQLQQLQQKNSRIYSEHFKEDPIREAEKMLYVLNDALYEANVNKNPSAPFSFDILKSLAVYLGFPTCFLFFYQNLYPYYAYTQIGEEYIGDMAGYQAVLSILAAANPTQPAIANAWGTVATGVRNVYTKCFIAPLTELEKYFPNMLFRPGIHHKATVAFTTQIFEEEFALVYASTNPRKPLEREYYTSWLGADWEQEVLAKFQEIKSGYPFTVSSSLYPYMVTDPFSLNWFQPNVQRLKWRAISYKTDAIQKCYVITFMLVLGQEHAWYTPEELHRAITPMITAEIHKFQQFLISLREVMQILAVEPIEEDSGRQEIVYRPGPVRPYQDIKNDIANQLSGLPNFSARVKIGVNAPQNPGKKCLSCGQQSKSGAKFCQGCGTQLPSPNEYTLTALKPASGLNTQQLDQRIKRIQARNLQQGYPRDRKTVEAEITQRQLACSSGAAPAQHARQVLVQGQCSNCGFSNPRGANFCMKCGTKL